MTRATIDRDDPLLDPIKGIKVLDVDTHLTEPGDLWSSRAPEKYRDLLPRVVWKDNDGKPNGLGQTWSDGKRPWWVVEEDTVLGYAGGGSVINKANEKVRGSDFIQWPLTEVSAAASYVAPRLEAMDEVGIWGQIVYPNAVGFGGNALAKIKDPIIRQLCLTIWNDAMVEMQEESGQRLFGMGMVPWWDVDLAVKEIDRVAELGLKGVNLTSDTQNFGGLPDLSDAYYQPMWDACARNNLPVNFHIGSSVTPESYMGLSPWPSLDNDQKLAVGSSLMYLSNARVLSNLIFSGLLDRNPEMKIVSVESGIGWIPFILTALEYQALEADVKLKMRPSEYFDRQLYACFWFEDGDNLMHDIESIGIDNCMFETDFPHPTCLYPQPLNEIAQTFEKNDVSFENRKKLLGGTAARVYNIDIPED